MSISPFMEPVAWRRDFKVRGKVVRVGHRVWFRVRVRVSIRAGFGFGYGLGLGYALGLG